MKQGLVEITTTGLISDFDDAILITREEVESVNELVKVSTFYTKIIGDRIEWKLNKKYVLL
jgi:hypothetical protein